MSKPSIPKGTRDFTPAVMARRQWIFSTLVWMPPVAVPVLWTDRSLAVLNMAMLSRAHAALGVPWSLMGVLLAFAVTLKLIDFRVAVNAEVTAWYIGWHVSLFSLNAGLAMWAHR